MRWPEQGLLSCQAQADACPNLAIRDLDLFVSPSEYSLNANCTPHLSLAITSSCWAIAPIGDGLSFATPPPPRQHGTLPETARDGGVPHPEGRGR